MKQKNGGITVVSRPQFEEWQAEWNQLNSTTKRHITVAAKKQIEKTNHNKKAKGHAESKTDSEDHFSDCQSESSEFKHENDTPTPSEKMTIRNRKNRSRSTHDSRQREVHSKRPKRKCAPPKKYHQS